MMVYVLLFHDVWDTTRDVPEGNPYGEPEDVSVAGVFASYTAAEAAQPDLEGSSDYYTIEEHELRR